MTPIAITTGGTESDDTRYDVRDEDMFVAWSGSSTGMTVWEASLLDAYERPDLLCASSCLGGFLIIYHDVRSWSLRLRWTLGSIMDLCRYLQAALAPADVRDNDTSS